MVQQNYRPRGAFLRDGVLLKRCCKCKSDLVLAEYRLKGNQRYQSICKKCENRQKKWRRLHALGAGRDEYDRKLFAQNGVCAICKKPEVKMDRKGHRFSLAVDHDHITGSVRDLLCCRCNTLLGWAGDDPALLREAAAYLERHRLIE